MLRSVSNGAKAASSGAAANAKRANRFMNDDAPTNVLLVDDEQILREPLAEYLTGQGFAVTEADSAAAARSRLLDSDIDIALVDIMMPGEDGLSLTRHLVETRGLPTILLTAKGEATDRIVGLEIGADDYVTKPFEPRELVARIRSVLRRSGKSHLVEATDDTSQYAFEGWRLDPLKQQLTDPDDAVVPISTTEFQLLTVLLDHPRQVMHRDRLLELVKGREAHAFDRAVDNQISRLRRKVETDPRDPKLIQTVWGGGYRLAAEVRRISAGKG